MLLDILFNVAYLVISVVLVFLILIQSSKGAGLAGAFGAGGGSESFLGAASSATVVVKAALGFAVAFLLLTLVHGFLPHYQPTGSAIAGVENSSGYMTVTESIENDAATEQDRNALQDDSASEPAAAPAE